MDEDISGADVKFVSLVKSKVLNFVTISTIQPIIKLF